MAVRSLGPNALRLVQAVRSVLEPGRRSLVACSGGPDSLALAAAVAHLRPDAYAVTVDHGLQPDSAATAAATRDQLTGLGLTAETVAIRVDPNDSAGPEGAARTARYAALDRAADRLEAGAILLGHTRDDQAETVLLGLARGSGPRSLAGMARATGRYRRPLLDLPREATVAACAEWGLTPWTDPHNADPGYARVRVRVDALPALEAALGPGVAAALARTAALARADADLLDQLAADRDPGAADLDCADLAGLPAALRGRVIRRWLLRSGADQPTQHHVEAVSALVTDWHGQRGIDLPAVRVSRRQGRLSAQRR